MNTGKQRKILKSILAIFSMLMLIAVITFLAYYLVVTKDSNLAHAKLPLSYQNITIYDRKNNDVTSMYYSNYIQKNEITDNIKLAFLTTEDRKFYTHNGIDYKRIISASMNNLLKGNLSQGGSTITQQLVKNTHLTSDKNLSRKLKEFKIAKQLEENFSKDEILTMYLNVLYFGNGIYGIKNASKVFFDKQPAELNFAECCMLAGVVKNPSRYSPIANFEKSNARKNLILKMAKENGTISNEVYQNQANYEIKIANNVKINNFMNSYMTNAIYETKSILGLKNSDKLPSGIKIYTNLDVDLQREISNIVSKKQGTVKNENGVYPDNVIAVSDNYSGGVIAFASSYKYSQYLVKRQIGSTAKPFASYLAALEQGIINVATPILDEKTDFGGYSPSNYKDVYHGYVDMRESLAHSYNIPAVKIMNEVGVNNAKNFLNKFGFNTVSNDGLPVALGGFTFGQDAVTLLSAYSTLANGGERQNLKFVNKIVVNNDVYTNYNLKNRVCKEGNAYIITDCLKSTVKDGTLKKLSYLPYEIAGKTGTVRGKNGNSDSYSVSYTSAHTVLSWQGNLSNKAENDLAVSNTGGSYPASQTAMVYEYLYKDNSPNNFNIPSDVIEEEIDLYTLKRLNKVVKANPLFPTSLKKWEIFTVDNAPSEFSTIFNDISKLDVTAEKSADNVKLSFVAKDFVSYEIYRYGLFNKKLITVLEKQDGLIEFIDEKNNGKMRYSYIIKPYFDYDGKKIYLKDKYVSVL